MPSSGGNRRGRGRPRLYWRSKSSMGSPQSIQATKRLINEEQSWKRLLTTNRRRSRRQRHRLHDESAGEKASNRSIQKKPTRVVSDVSYPCSHPVRGRPLSRESTLRRSRGVWPKRAEGSQTSHNLKTKNAQKLRSETSRCRCRRTRMQQPSKTKNRELKAKPCFHSLTLCEKESYHCEEQSCFSCLIQDQCSVFKTKSTVASIALENG